MNEIKLDDCRKALSALQECHEAIIHFREMDIADAPKPVMANCKLILLKAENRAKSVLTECYNNIYGPVINK